MVVVVVVVVRVVVTMVFVMPLLSANMRTFPVNDLRAVLIFFSRLFIKYKAKANVTTNGERERERF